MTVPPTATTAIGSAPDKTSPAWPRPIALRAVPAWVGYLVIGLALSLVYLVLPVAAQDQLYVLIACSTPVAIGVAIARYRPRQRAWALVAVGAGLMAAGEVAFAAGGNGLAPAIADPLYLLGYVALAAAMVGFVRRQRSSVASILDAGILAVAAASVLWVLVIAPVLADTTRPVGEVLVTAAYPIADVVIIGLLLRVLLDRGRVTPALILFATGVAVFLVADLVYSVITVDAPYANGILDLGWMAGYVLWGAAALHPSMAASTDRATADPRVHDRRLTALAIVAVVPVAMAFTDQIRHGGVDPRPTVVVSAVMFLLVVLRLIDLVRDQRNLIEERALIQGTLERLSVEDALTGLVNRRGFSARLADTLARSPVSTSVMLFDLDDFKQVNDSHGHGAGDAVLVAVGQRLRTGVRAGDTVARLGGDEFAALMIDLSGPLSALAVAERLAKALTEPVMVGDTLVQVGVSIGIAMPGPNGTDADTLLRNADLALYRAKERQDRRIELYDEELHREAVRSLVLRNDLPSAIVHGQLLLEFQPIVDLASSRPIALEALVRWRHPELGVLPPAEFMPIAESSGAAAALGRWVVTQACTALGSWPDTGDPVRVNVNLATAQVRDEHLVDDVREAIATAGIEPSRLVFEVTEAILDLGPGVRARLAELANLGVGLSIDDFGTGYSSLARVGQLRLEELKIDRSLLETDRRLLGAVRSFATSLGLRVVMEGVQSRRELRLVRDLGFDAAQGYVIGRPMAADSVPAYLTRTARARPTAPLLPVAAIGA